MSAQHTQGRLVAETAKVSTSGQKLPWWVKTESGNPMNMMSEADARRLAACWNACLNMPIEHIEALDGIGNLGDLVSSKWLPSKDGEDAAREVVRATAKLMTYWRDRARKNDDDLFAARALLEQVMPLCVQVAEHATITERIRAFLKGGA